MKKNIVAIVLALFIVLTLCACNGSNESSSVESNSSSSTSGSESSEDKTSEAKVFEVIYDYVIEGVESSSEMIEAGQQATEIEPAILGYNFLGWYEDENFNKRYDFSTPITKNITLYAKWEQQQEEGKKVLVSFAYAGGSGSLSPLEVNVNTSISLPTNNVVREGYQLTGWCEQQNPTVVFSLEEEYLVNKEVTLVAVWTKTVTVKYFYEDSLVEEITCLANKEINLLDSINNSNPGYEFVGWLDKNNVFYNKNGAYQLSTYDVDFVAAFSGEYEITFEKDGATGTFPTDGMYKTGDVINLPKEGEIIKTGYILLGFTDGIDDYEIGSKYTVKYSNSTITPVFKRDTHTVRFIDWDNFVLKTEEVEAGGAATAPDIAVTQVSEFVGWNKEFNNVTGDLMVRAVYNYTPAPVSSFIFTMNEDLKSYSITAKNKLASTLPGILYIPHSYRGLLVTAISDFTDLPANTVEIGFFQCQFLTEIHFPSSLEKIGTNAFFNCKEINKIVFPKDSKLESIGRSAFYSNSSLVSVEMPSTLKTIGASVFSNATGLQTLVFEEDAQLEVIGDSAFQGCISLREINLPDSLEKIGKSSFQNCSALESIIFGENLSTIDSAAFFNCTKLAIIEFNSTKLTEISDRSFFGSAVVSLVIPSSVLRIGKSAFYGSLNLKEVTFEGTPRLRELGEACFGRALSLMKFNSQVDGIYVIPNSVIKIDALAFVYNVNIEEVQFAQNCLVEYIGDYAFSGSHPLYETTDDKPNKMKKFTIPASVTHFGENVLLACDELQNIYVEEGNLLFKEANGCVLSADGKTLYAYPTSAVQETLSIPAGVENILTKVFFKTKYLKNVVVPNSVLTIAEEAFAESNIESITIGNQLEVLDTKVFYKCLKLKTVLFAENSKLTRIGECAFMYCEELLKITVPASVKYIGAQAFDSCYNIGEFIFEENSVLEEIGNIAFFDMGKNRNALSFVIPKSCITISEGAFYSSYITEVSFEENPKIEIIENSAFQSSKIEKFILPNTVKELGASAFFQCTNLVEFEFESGSTLTKLNNSLFSSTGIKRIAIPESVVEFGDAVFNGSKLEEFIMSDNITKIGIYTFMNNNQLKKIVMSNNLTNYPIHTFSGCTSLIDVTLGNKTSVIGNFAFYNCINLEKITIPSLVTIIGMSSFANASSLKEITVLGATPPKFASSSSGEMSAEITNSVFKGAEKLEAIYVQPEYIINYKQGWTTLSSIIKEKK